MELSRRLERFMDALGSCRRVGVRIRFSAHRPGCFMTSFRGRCTLVISVPGTSGLGEVAAACTPPSASWILRAVLLAAIALFGILGFVWQLPSAVLGGLLTLAAVAEGLVKGFGRARRGGGEAGVTSLDEYNVQRVAEVLEKLIRVAQGERSEGYVDLAGAIWRFRKRGGDGYSVIELVRA